MRQFDYMDLLILPRTMKNMLQNSTGFTIEVYARLKFIQSYANSFKLETDIATSKCLQQNRRFPNVAGISLCFDRESLEGAATRNGWGWRWREARGGWGGGGSRSVGYIHTACENVGRNFWNSVVSLPRATRIPLHSSSLSSSLTSPPPLSLSLRSIDLSSASSSSLSCCCRSSSRADILDATRRDVKLTRCFENFNSRYQTL